MYIAIGRMGGEGCGYILGYFQKKPRIQTVLRKQKLLFNRDWKKEEISIKETGKTHEE